MHHLPRCDLSQIVLPLTLCVDLILHASLKETPERFLSKYNVPSIIFYPGFCYRGVQTALTAVFFADPAAEQSGAVLLGCLNRNI